MISVIVPIYKVEAYLCRCVDSILDQSYTDFELILVDDGSPDRCPEICDAYAAADARVRVIHKENGGLSDARNAGLVIARGVYIAFVDSDDWVAPDYLKALLNGLLSRNSDICECAVLRTAEKTCVSMEANDKTTETFDTVQAMALLIEDKTLHQHVWNKLYRRDTIGDILFPKGKLNEDEFWTYQIFGRARKISRISDTLYYYFQRPGSIMGEGYSLNRLHALDAKCKRQEYIQENFSQLASLAKVNLFFSCVYSAQMSMMHLNPDEYRQAKKQIERYCQTYPLTWQDVSSVKGSRALWCLLGKLNFWRMCKIRNHLKKGF